MNEQTAENDVRLEVLAARLYLADGAAQGTPFIAAAQPVRDRYLRMAQAAVNHFRQLGIETLRFDRGDPASGPTIGSAETLAEVLCTGVPGVECSHVPNQVPSCERDAAAILASDWMKRHDAEVRAEALRPVVALVEESMIRPQPGYVSALTLRAALTEEGDRG